MKANELPVFCTDDDTNCTMLTEMLNTRFAGFLAAMCRKRNVAFADVVYDAKKILHDAEIPQFNLQDIMDDEEDVCMRVFDSL